MTLIKRIKETDPLIGFKMPRGQQPSTNPEEIVTIEITNHQLKIQGQSSNDKTSENYLSVKTKRTEGRNRVLEIQGEGYLIRRLNELQGPYREVAEQVLSRRRAA